ncbi:MAG: hypothetical protein V9F00_18065 [Nocardioides sp.]
MTWTGSIVLPAVRLLTLASLTAPGRTRRRRQTRSTLPQKALPDVAEKQLEEPSPTGVSERAAVPRLRGSRGAVRDLDLGEVSASHSRVSVNGRIASSQRTVCDFVVVIEWIDDAGDVRGRGVVILADVQPEEKRWFTLVTRVEGVSDESVRCVPQAFAGVLESAGAA